MNCFTRLQLSDPSVIASARAHAGGERTNTAHLLADIAEIDERNLYLSEGYPSLRAWCVGELQLCEHAALKRIHAARAARRFPAIFPALAEGRLHLTAVVLLAPHLAEDTAKELLAGATRKSKSEIERLLAARFPKPDVLAWMTPIPSASPTQPERPEVGAGACQLAPGRVQNGALPPAPAERASAKPLSSRSLGFKPQESRDAAELCREMRMAPLEERVRVALSHFRPRGVRKVYPAQNLGPATSSSRPVGGGATERIASAVP